ncbi:sulfatase family protein [Pedobacter glucosidilyticus]|uniref:sulfatase family protein n=1 Tax=Pedobacter glucosidilyticus TaxID=1122941 RepID=UPI000412E76F|nr:sulfatase [Pedobacter glucosidilyticus]
MFDFRHIYWLSMLLAFLTHGCKSKEVKKQPNIVIIISDDHSFQTIGAYGSKIIKTPNIDRIAKEGVTFNKAYVTNSICGPSRAVILTGKYSHKNGFKDNETSVFNYKQDMFVKHLATNGYQTAWIGKQHLGNKTEGFTYYNILPEQGDYYNPEFIRMDGSIENTEGYVTNIIEEKAENWLDKRDPNKPFCLVIGHKATHRTWIPDTSDFNLYDDVKFPLPATFYDDYKWRKAASLQEMQVSRNLLMSYDLKMLSYASENEPMIERMNPAQRAKFDAYYKPIEADLKSRNLSGKALAEWKYERYMRDYASTVASLDRNIGRTLDYLDKNNLTENTVVIYLSDQGFYMGEHGWFDKRWMYEESFRTPMVMRYPRVVKAGTVSENMILNLDIAPTMLDIAGLAIPKEMQGESFMPIITGDKKKERDAIFYHYYENGEHAVSPHFGIRTKRYKLIRFYKKVEGWELYDLEKDPYEIHNVYDNPVYQKVIPALKSRMIQLIDKYEDTDAKKILNKK